MTLAHVRSAGTPPGSGRLEARLYIIGSSRLAMSWADNPIKPWAASTSYAVGDLVKYNNVLYQSRHAGSASEFTQSHWYNLALQPKAGNAIGVSYPNNNQEFTIAVESGGIETDELADGGVTTAKIADAAVTEAKMAAGVLPTVRGAGTGLELDGNNLALVLDILAPAFGHRIVRTYVTTVDGSNNNFEVAISNDNVDSVVRCGSAIGSSSADDALLIEKETAAKLLENITSDNFFLLSRGDNRMLARVYCQDADPSDAGVSRVWFNGDAAYKKGVNEYLQMGSGSGIIAISDMGSPAYMRDALPTGVTPTITQSTDLLLADWGDVSVEHLNEHIVPKTTAPTDVTGTWETASATIINKNGTIGWLNTIVNGVGTLQWALPDSVPVQGGGTIPAADVIDYFNQHHSINLSFGSVVIKGPLQNFADLRSLSGYVTITIGDNTKCITPPRTDPRICAVQTGTINDNTDDGAAVAIGLQSDLVDRDEFAETAFKANIPSGAALVLVYGTASASANCIKWNTTNSRAEWAAC